MAESAGSGKAGSGKAGGGEFVCPECGKGFARAAALGSHRRRAHGVAGVSKSASGGRDSAKGGRSRTASSRRGATARSRATASGAQAGRGLRAAVPRGAVTDGRLDRDQLLRTLFPNGVPPREEVLRAVNSWLEEAERLAQHP